MLINNFADKKSLKIWAMYQKPNKELINVSNTEAGFGKGVLPWTFDSNGLLIEVFYGMIWNPNSSSSSTTEAGFFQGVQQG